MRNCELLLKVQGVMFPTSWYNPNYSFAFNNKGLALYYLNKYEDAIECYDRAIQINPNNQLALDNKKLAMNYLKK